MIKSIGNKVVYNVVKIVIIPRYDYGATMTIGTLFYMTKGVIGASTNNKLGLWWN